MANKIKTFTVGIADGYRASFETLDRLVAELGDIKIKSVKDQYLIRPFLHPNRDAIQGKDECITRLLVYED